MVSLKRAFEAAYGDEHKKYFCPLRIEKSTNPYNYVAAEQPDNGVGDKHPAWDILIPKLNYQCQLKMSQQSRRLTDIVKNNAESKLRKYRREIEDKNM